MTLARFSWTVDDCSQPFLAHSVAPTLCPPLLLPRVRVAIPVPCLPLSPSPCLFTAFLAAVTHQGAGRSEPSLASLQQAHSLPRPPSSPPRLCASQMLGLIFFCGWMIFRRAHGRCLLPEAQASKRELLLPFGAPLCRDRTPLLYLSLRNQRSWRESVCFRVGQFR
jgi:hypothetical protein